MAMLDRLPALPLVASDPYFSIWMPADTPTQTDSCHWSGPEKPLRGSLTVDGAAFRFLGTGPEAEAELTAQQVTATATRFVHQAGGVRLETVFRTPALPQDPDLLSMPVTLVSFSLASVDGGEHQVALRFHLSDKLCYDGNIRPAMTSDSFAFLGHGAAWCGQTVQRPLSHSGDHVTMDWGYLYLMGDGQVSALGDGLALTWAGAVKEETGLRAVVAYDDIASINYFGDLCKPWYRRHGAQITDAIRTAWEGFEAIAARCQALDLSLIHI